MKGRLVLIGVVALALAPGTWLRDGLTQDERQLITMQAIGGRTPGDWPEQLTLERIWLLSSPHDRFGGYSSLVIEPDGSLLAFGDRGDMMRLPRPGGSMEGFAIAQVPRDPDYSSVYQDIEAATLDPDTGRIWLAYEFHNIIRRFSADMEPIGTVQPAAMRKWSENSGAEAMTRLPDGRFILLPELSRKGLLFPADPVTGATPQAFELRPMEDYSPVDMANLADGRVLILYRKIAFGLPPFSALLVVADPDQISPKGQWPMEILVSLDDLPRENFEGLAIEPLADGGHGIWIISDDNLAALQRTLLIELRWSPQEGERKKARRPRSRRASMKLRKNPLRRLRQQPSSVRASPSGRAWKASRRWS